MAFWAGKRVLVTGGSGFIGSHVVDLLLDRGVRVTATTTQPGWPAALSHLGRDRLLVVRADLTRLDDCVEACRGQNLVVNLAHSDGSIEFKQSQPASIFERNMLITMNMLHAAADQHVERFLVMSSAEVYPQSASGLLHESAATTQLSDRPDDGYAWSKRMSECAARLFARQHAMAVAIARPNNVYGPRDYFHSARSRVIPALIRQILENDSLTIWGDGTQLRSFLYVDDLARGLLDLVEHYAVCEPVNFAGAEEVSIRELAELISVLAGKPCRIVCDPDKPSGAMRRTLDTSVARQSVGFEAQVPLRVGLQRTIRAYLDSRELARDMERPALTGPNST